MQVKSSKSSSAGPASKVGGQALVAPESKSIVDKATATISESVKKHKVYRCTGCGARSDENRWSYECERYAVEA